MTTRGINLIGHVGSNLGLGVAARNTAELLAQRGDDFTVVNVPTSTLDPSAETTWAERYWTGSAAPPHAVNLFHMNPPEIRADIRTQPSWMQLDGRVNAIVPFWELSSFPPMWTEVLDRFDVILAPTRFVEGLARTATPHPRVIHFPPTVYVPEGIAPDRSRWGFADDEVVFATSFDLNSDLARKNPQGAIEAFLRMDQALDPGTEAKLAIKVNNAASKQASRRLEALHRLAAEHPHIQVISEHMGYRDVLSLYASADAFVSLHRAEGLGLALLESMMLGTPVIGTCYSGNLDFMTDEDSLLVDFELVPVEGTAIGSYDPSKLGAGQMWAEPSIEDAAAKMHLLASDRFVRAKLAESARTAARATQTDPERSAAIDVLLQLAKDPPAASRLRELADGSALYWRTRRKAIRLLRKLGL